MQKLLFAIAIAFGFFFAYVESRPTWDDTGVLAFSIAIASGVLGFLGPQRPWLWALAIGIWTPLYNIMHSGQFASLIAVAIAFAGAYAGAGLHWISARTR